MLPPEALETARRVADQAPPLSPRQSATIRALLAPALEQLHGHKQGAA
jgi:hypothetical protein